jgi:hypothetical protein
MPEPLDLPSPEVRGAAGFEQNRCRGPLGEEAQQLSAAQPVPLRDPPGPGRNGELEDGLCEVDGDGCALSCIGCRIVGHGLLLSLEHVPMHPTTLALQMPIKSKEESISSFKPKPLRGSA